MTPAVERDVKQQINRNQTEELPNDTRKHGIKIQCLRLQVTYLGQPKLYLYWEWQVLAVCLKHAHAFGQEHDSYSVR